MTDIPEHIYKLQYKIIAAKPMAESVRLGLKTIDTARVWIENIIRHDTPNISKVGGIPTKSDTFTEATLLATYTELVPK